MATKTFEELKQLAIQIRDEKTNKQNTATRIGTQMLEHLDKLEQDYYDKTATNEELQARDEKLTELESKIDIDVNEEIKEASSISLPTILNQYKAILEINGITNSATAFLFDSTDSINPDKRSYFGDSGTVSNGTYTTITKQGQNSLRIIPKDGNILNVRLSIKILRINKDLEDTKTEIINSFRTDDSEIIHLLQNKIDTIGINIFQEKDIISPLLNIPNSYISNQGKLINNAAETRSTQIYLLKKGQIIKLSGYSDGAAVSKYALFKDISLTELIEKGEVGSSSFFEKEVTAELDYAYLAVSSFKSDGGISLFAQGNGYQENDIYKKIFSRSGVVINHNYNSASAIDVKIINNSKYVLYIKGITNKAQAFLYDKNDPSNSEKRSYFGNSGVVNNGIFYTYSKESQNALRIIPEDNDNLYVGLIYIDEDDSISKNVDVCIEFNVSESMNIPFKMLNKETGAVLKLSGISDTATSYLFSDIDNEISRSYFGDSGTVSNGTYTTTTKIGQNSLRIIPKDGDTIKLSLWIKISKCSQSISTSGIGKEIFSIWDSLGSMGIWQKKLAELSGASFDNELNKILSVGGRFVLDEGYSAQCGMYATKYLIDSYKVRANNGLIFLENVHDLISGTISDNPFFVENSYLIDEIYSDRDAAIQALSDISTISSGFTPKINSVIIAKYGNISKILTITNQPTVGTFYMVEKVDGDEIDRYGVTVSQSDTVDDILQAISVYEYQNFVASVSEKTVVFSQKTTNNATLEVEANGTGISVSFTEQSSVNQIGKGFVDKNIQNWNSSESWKLLSSISLYSKLKGQIEYLQKNLPNAKIYFVAPTYSIIKEKENQPDFYYEDGMFNVVAWKNYAESTNYSNGNGQYQKLIDTLKEVAKLYGIITIDIMNYGGISPLNWLSYYAYGNSHPVQINGDYPAYKLWAEYIYKNI